MVHTVAVCLSYQIAGVPVGAWLALAALAEIQDRLRTSRWKSNTIVQLFINGTIGRLRAKYAIEPAAPVLPSDTAPTEPTRQRSDHGFVSAPAMMVLGAIGLALAFVLAGAGCGATSDDLRRACATEEAGLAGGYRVGAALYRARIEAAKEADDVSAARKQLAADTVAYDKLVAILDGVSAEAEVQCSAADAIDAGAKKDVRAMISIVSGAAVHVAEAVATIQATFSGGAK